jgi:chitinase
MLRLSFARLWLRDAHLMPMMLLLLLLLMLLLMLNFLQIDTINIVGNNNFSDLISQRQHESFSDFRNNIQSRDIPEKVLIGYASRNYSNVMQAVEEDGVNIVIWSFGDISFASTPADIYDHDIYSGGTLLSSSHRALDHYGWNSTSADHNQHHHGELPVHDTRTQQEQRRRRQTQQHFPGEDIKSTGGLDLGQIQDLIRTLDADGYSHVIHLLSFGGWNGPHLHPASSSAKFAARMWYSSWVKATASKIFHGIDWDFEGNDDRSSPDNVFTVECLDTVGEISRLMKENGFVVTMAPPQSYLNFNTSHFSRYVNLTVPGRRWHAEVAYFGSNVYAFLLAKYGDYVDLVSVQLYESYSDAAMSVYHNEVHAEEYLYSLVRNIAIENQSFYVDFSQDHELKVKFPSRFVKMELSKFVIGLANGWAMNDDIPFDQRKTLFVSADDCFRAYNRLKHVRRHNASGVYGLYPRRKGYSRSLH